MTYYVCQKCEIICTGESNLNSMFLQNGCNHEWDIYIPSASDNNKDKQVIKFIVDEKSNANELTFSMVDVNQFFINDYGYLCIKHTDHQYSTLADGYGHPFGEYWQDVPEYTTINKILPKVKKIEF